MSNATKPIVAKATGKPRPASSRQGLRKPTAAAQPTQSHVPDASGEDALANAISTLVKGVIVGLIIMAVTIVAYVFVQQNRHKSMAEIVNDLFAQPHPKLVSLIAACPTPSVPTIAPEPPTFSPELAGTLSTLARETEAVTQFIACAITTETQRLCKPSNRAALAADLKIHARLRNNLSALAEATRQLRPSERLDQVFVDGIRRDLDTAVEVAAQQVTNADSVARPVARLVQANLLSPSDFGVLGFGKPATLSDALNVAPTSPFACPADSR
jgi:hypothetical protein